MSLAFYKETVIPSYEFVDKLKKIDKELYVVFDGLSQRWHIYFKDVKGQTHCVYKVCERDYESRDIGYRQLDDRTIDKLRRMDLKTRNISPKEYLTKVRDAEDEEERKKALELENTIDYAFKHEKRTLSRARDALRGVYRTY